MCRHSRANPGALEGQCGILSLVKERRKGRREEKGGEGRGEERKGEERKGEERRGEDRRGEDQIRLD